MEVDLKSLLNFGGSFLFFLRVMLIRVLGLCVGNRRDDDGHLITVLDVGGLFLFFSEGDAYMSPSLVPCR